MVASALHLLTGLSFASLIKDNKMKLSFILGSYIPDFDILLIPYLEPTVRIHRTFTHSFYFLLFLFLLYKLTNKVYLNGLFYGVSLHIALDIFIGGGIYLFYPIFMFPIGFNFSHFLLNSILADILFSIFDCLLLFILSIFYSKDKMILNFIIFFSFTLLVYMSLVINLIDGYVPFIILPFILYFYRSSIYKWTVWKK